MIDDDRGQISLEYLLIFAISLILLIAFTLPLAEIAIEKTMDISNTLNAKGELSKLSGAISQVYGEGQGARQTVFLDVNRPTYVKITNSYISASLKLSDGKSKTLILNHNSNLASGGLNLDKGENKIIVEWPIGEEKMIIYKKY
ncbi:MAG: class III signal peptide-containing protein [Methanobrevibacter sp.]|uniref:class III signal peptide-containing protein n=1 Tax=Methanobrevibacter sp. TaxID=66852 RepID=UPI0025D3AA1E|nr:class III signal peptide-containing protein [Methanobrevibacter sp.]MBR0271264.1 class III signal peptide-containing protein [Methanobrevibacter sp.]